MKPKKSVNVHGAACFLPLPCLQALFFQEIRHTIKGYEKVCRHVIFLIYINVSNSKQQRTQLFNVAKER